MCGEPGCPNLRPCPTHKPKPWTNSTRRERVASGWQQQRDAKRILARYNDTCYVCGQPATFVDHVVPVGEGGADTDANKRPICDECHQKKTKSESARARWVGGHPRRTR